MPPPTSPAWLKLPRRLRPWLDRSAGGEAPIFLQRVAATFTVKMVVLALGVVASVIVARALGPAGRGIYGAGAVLATLGSQFSNLGLPTANSYYVARDHSLLPTLVTNAIWVTVLGGGVIALLLAALFTAFPAWAPVHGRSLGLALLLIPATLGTLLASNLLLGIKQVHWFNVTDVAGRIAFVGLCAAAAWWHRMSANQVLAIAIAAAAVTTVWAFHRLLVLVPKASWRPQWGLLRYQAHYGLRSYITCLAGYAVLRIDVLMVMHIAGPTATGFYSLASSMADLIYVFPTVVGMILFPVLTETTDLGARWRRTQRAMGGVGVGMAVIAAAAALAARPLTSLLYGAVYLPAVAPFLVLCAAVVFYGVNSVISIYLSSCGQPWFSVILWPLAAALNVGLNLLFIPRWGIVGAAYASLIAYAALLLVQTIYSRRLARTAPPRLGAELTPQLT